MAIATPTRHALSELPVNTLGTPSMRSSVGKETTNNKRPILEVADPEYAQPMSRVRLSPRPQPACKDVIPHAEVGLPPNGRLENAVESNVQAQLSAAAPANPPNQQAPTYAVTQHATTHRREDFCKAPRSHVVSLEEEVEEGDSQNSYNSMIDFDPDDTMISQQTAATEVTQPLQSRASQHAENLRLRLRLAHFKVRTNQTHIPLSQLQISAREDRGSPEHQPSLPTLLPAPVLLPTAYSARTIAQPQIPSSPPSSPDNSAEKTIRDEVFRTPALPRHSTSFRQMSSPPDSQERTSRKPYTEEDNLTSSAVRGKAAFGLLGLRQER